MERVKGQLEQAKAALKNYLERSAKGRLEAQATMAGLETAAAAAGAPSSSGTEQQQQQQEHPAEAAGAPSSSNSQPKRNRPDRSRGWHDRKMQQRSSAGEAAAEAEAALWDMA